MLSIKDKEIILKAAREKHQLIFNGKPIRIAADFLRETLNSRTT
jgi:hypothetical protein